MKFRNVILSAVTLVGALGLTAGASADVIATFSSTVGTSATQLGRLSRNAIIQDWTGTEAYPGVIGTTTTYYYKTYDITPVQLEYGQYIQIEMDSLSTSTFLSAYSGSYSPANKALNWLGDAGSSGDFFGTDPIFFQVFVPTLKDLILVINTTSGTTVGAADPFTITVESFSDTDYDSPTGIPPSSPVPEPSTLVLLGSGAAAMAGAVRRRFKV